MPSLRIDEVEFLHLAMPLKAPFTTSFGTLAERHLALLRLSCEGITGWGELTAFQAPLYNEETVETALHILREFIVPRILGRTFSSPAELVGTWRGVRRNYMAKAALEGAFWDAWAQARNLSLARALGGERSRIEVGVSIGIQERVPDLIGIIEGFLDRGYRRIKIKIQPGWDVDVVREVGRALGDIPLMVDANSAYTLDDIEHLRRLDEFDLMMIEQPLGHDDIVDHARLQSRLHTPVCLDESIHTVEDARRALDIGACRIINIKVGRIGGLCAMQEIHDLCRSRGVPLWCGGMLETGIGRLHNVALTTLPGFTLPGDTSGSDRYWEHDIIDPPVTVAADGTVAVPEGTGIGHRVLEDRIRQFLVRRLPLGVAGAQGTSIYREGTPS